MSFKELRGFRTCLVQYHSFLLLLFYAEWVDFNEKQNIFEIRWCLEENLHFTIRLSKTASRNSSSETLWHFLFASNTCKKRSVKKLIIGRLVMPLLTGWLDILALTRYWITGR